MSGAQRARAVANSELLRHLRANELSPAISGASYCEGAPQQKDIAPDPKP